LCALKFADLVKFDAANAVCDLVESDYCPARRVRFRYVNHAAILTRCGDAYLTVTTIDRVI